MKINFSNFILIPNVPFAKNGKGNPSIAALNIRSDGKRVYGSLSAQIRKKIDSGYVLLYADLDLKTVLIVPSTQTDVDSYRFNSKNGALYCASFGRYLQENGQSFPVRFTGEYDEDQGVFVLTKQTDASPKKTKAANKPRSKGLESLLPQK